MDQALTAQTAGALQAKLAQTVGWRCVGWNGVRLADILTEFQQLPVARFDAIIVSIGVNDVTGLTSLLRWSQQVLDLVVKLKQRYQVPVYFCAVPPMHLFTALPQPLRFVLGIRARLLNKVLARTAAAVDNLYFVSPQISTDQTFLAEDGYHPSVAGYNYLGQQLADAIYPHLAHQRATVNPSTPETSKGSS
jgi:lysophospholipase L1-like esterase